MTDQQDAMHRALGEIPAPRAPDVADTASRIGAVLGAFLFMAGLLVGVAVKTSWNADVVPRAPQGAVVISDTIKADSAFAALVSRLEDEEGFSATPYRDAGGFAIGYGLNLSTGGFPPDKVDRWLRDGITTDEARDELRSIVRSRIDGLTSGWAPFAAQPIGIRYALVDAAYELGTAGLLAFHDTLRDITLHDPDAAAEDIRSSVWYGQAPKRAERLIEVIRREA